MRDHAEVSPVSRRGDLARAQPLSVRLQDGLRFFRNPIPAAPSARLAARFPALAGGRRAYHVPHTRLGRVRPCLSAGGRFICGRAAVNPCSWATHLLVRALCFTATSTLSSFQMTTFISSSYSWPYRPTRPPTALVLAVARSLHSRRASSMLRATLSRRLLTFALAPASPGRVAGAEPRVSSLHRASY